MRVGRGLQADSPTAASDSELPARPSSIIQKEAALRQPLLFCEYNSLMLNTHFLAVYHLFIDKKAVKVATGGEVASL